MRFSPIFGGLFAVLMIFTAPAIAGTCDTPKPDFELTKPSAAISPTIAPFAGQWLGTWRINTRRQAIDLCTRLYVNLTDNSTAKVAYCRGSLTEVGRTPTCLVLDAPIEGGIMKIRAQTFKLTGPNTISAQGESQTTRDPIYAEFHRER